MIPEALAAVGAAINPTKRKKNPTGSGPMIKRGKTVGARLKESFSTLPTQGLDMLGAMVGGSLANIIRVQIVGRIPIASAAGLQAIDWFGQNLITAPLLSMLPGDFGYMSMIGVRANTTQAAGRAMIPATTKTGEVNPLVSLLGVDEFRAIEAASDEAIEETAAAAGAMQRPGGVGAMQRPGGVGSRIRLSRAS